MTGGNFAIAETGTFMVCTNEGNATLGHLYRASYCKHRY